MAGEFRHARIRLGLSQETLGALLGISGDKIGKIERAELATLSFTDAAEIGALLGLDLSTRVYPNGSGIRDAAQSKQQSRLLEHVGSPLRSRTEVPLPQQPGQPRELRAWDCMLSDQTVRTAFEFESRITDYQAMVRRHALKRRDDPVDNFVLVVADTAHNRRVMREFAALLPELPRLRTSGVLVVLRAGRHPPSGWIFL